MASGSGWNLWVWLVGVVVKSSRYIYMISSYYLSLLLLYKLLYLFFFAAASLLYICSFFLNVFRSLEVINY